MNFSVVDNRYQGEGFAFVIENQPNNERWKNTQHGDHADRQDADTHAALLNEAWGGRSQAVTAAKMGRPHTLPAGIYATLAKKLGGVGRLAEALQVDRGTITRAAKAGRWLTGGPAVRLLTLCRTHGVAFPTTMKPDWI